MVADRHHRDDLAPVQEQGQRPLGDDRGLDRPALLVDAGDPSGQARIVGIGATANSSMSADDGYARLFPQAADAML